MTVFRIESCNPTVVTPPRAVESRWASPLSTPWPKTTTHGGIGPTMACHHCLSGMFLPALTY